MSEEESTHSQKMMENDFKEGKQGSDVQKATRTRSSPSEEWAHKEDNDSVDDDFHHKLLDKQLSLSYEDEKHSK